MSPLLRLTLGAIQSLNSTSFTSRPCLCASSTAASSGMAKAEVVPIFSGTAASALADRPRERATASTGRNNLSSMVQGSARGRGRGKAVGRARVVGGQMRVVGLEQFFAQGAFGIGGLVAATLLQLRDDQVDEVLEAFRGYGAGQVETVQTGF